MEQTEMQLKEEKEKREKLEAELQYQIQQYSLVHFALTFVDRECRFNAWKDSVKEGGKIEVQLQNLQQMYENLKTKYDAFVMG